MRGEWSNIPRGELPVVGVLSGRHAAAGSQSDLACLWMRPWHAHLRDDWMWSELRGHVTRHAAWSC